MAIYPKQDRLSSSSHHSRNGANNTRRRPRRQQADSGNNSDNDSLGKSNHSTSSTGSAASFTHSYKKPVMPPRSQYIAMDCEMVGTVSGQSVCARVVLVDWKGRAVYDTYVAPDEQVADYRTFVSGITPANLEGAPSMEVVREQVLMMLQGKILVGHGLENDLASLRITHPWWMTRDTAYYQPFMQLRTTADGQSFHAPRKLKDLCATKLQREVQVCGQAHSPTEDAISALDLYKSHRPRWETCMAAEIQKFQQQQFEQQMVSQNYYAVDMTTSMVDNRIRACTM